MNSIKDVLSQKPGKVRNPQQAGLPNKLSNKVSKEESEFKKILQESHKAKKANDDISFSSHATKRLEERNITIDGNEFVKLKGALAKLRDKGGKESLVVTENAAYIMDVDKGRVVTALDRDNLSENVFTKIDSTVFMN